ncbi:MAG: hypothetical protein WA705_11500 [Candidatus Ozemobacteraceae bacterium]
MQGSNNLIVYYALGGGLGHLTRAAAVLHTLANEEPVTILTGSSFAADPRIVSSQHQIVMVPSPALHDRQLLRNFLKTLFYNLRPSRILIDAFPAGVLGEFDDSLVPEGCECHHFARLLQWSTYRNRVPGSLPLFHQTFILEDLDEDHLHELRTTSGNLISLDLVDPPAVIPAFAQTLVEGRSLSSGHSKRTIHSNIPLWFIVHSDSGDELAELFSYARETARIEGISPRFVVVSPALDPLSFALPSDAVHIDMYPAWPLFGMADRLFSACGFNIMRQARNIRSRHVCMPFPRALDDQFRRAGRHHSNFQRSPGKAF